jgi:hypothetical protein
MKYKAFYNMKEIGIFDTFKEAFVAIYHAIKAETVLTWQVLETTIWIIRDAHGALPMMFYEARDRACEEGILVDGKLVE